MSAAFTPPLLPYAADALCQNCRANFVVVMIDKLPDWNHATEGFSA
ncbi:MAG: hypothetical protein WCD70_09890 [Alphaproteobacteria bacterium]